MVDCGQVQHVTIEVSKVTPGVASVEKGGGGGTGIWVDQSSRLHANWLESM